MMHLPPVQPPDDDAERILPPPVSRWPADPEPVAELLPRSTFGARPHQLGVVALEETVQVIASSIRVIAAVLGGGRRILVGAASASSLAVR